MNKHIQPLAFVAFAFLMFVNSGTLFAQTPWQSRYISLQKNGRLNYIPDQKGNTIPDFSRVGYHQNQKTIPYVKVVATLTATGKQDQQRIQAAINELAKQPADANGLRGAILLKKGKYLIPGSLNISAGGIVLRGEGNETQLIATGKGQRKTIMASGTGNPVAVPNSRVDITAAYVPVGTKTLTLTSTVGLKVGDQIMVHRTANAKWIQDLKMDQIEEKEGLVQWKAADYQLEFERSIVAINGKTITLDNPMVMAIESQYGGGYIYKYTFTGRIAEVGIENMLLESEYDGETDEDHGWDAVALNRIQNSWVKDVTSRYFGYSCVNLGNLSKQVTVQNCKSLAPKSQIIGGRRYSFNNDGQLNLVRDCFASEGRHDYVTGAKVAGPNVFFNCKAAQAQADIGPHHRWAVGTLYDNVVTDGEINIQDRGNWGTGHGWAGVNQVLWNCTAKNVAIQNPYVSGQNYAIGLKAQLTEGRLKGRPMGVVEGLNQAGLNPTSLYLKQIDEQTKK